MRRLVSTPKAASKPSNSRSDETPPGSTKKIPAVQRQGSPDKPRFEANLQTAIVNNSRKHKNDKRTAMVSLVDEPSKKGES